MGLPWGQEGRGPGGLATCVCDPCAMVRPDVSPEGDLGGRWVRGAYAGGRRSTRPRRRRRAPRGRPPGDLMRWAFLAGDRARPRWALAMGRGQAGAARRGHAAGQRWAVRKSGVAALGTRGSTRWQEAVWGFGGVPSYATRLYPTASARPSSSCYTRPCSTPYWDGAKA